MEGRFSQIQLDLRLIGCLKLQVIFCKRATNSNAFIYSPVLLVVGRFAQIQLDLLKYSSIWVLKILSIASQYKAEKARRMPYLAGHFAQKSH